MTGFETASLAIAAANATAAITAAAGIWHGIRTMVRANKDRAVILDRQREADERRHVEAMRRHDEAMQADERRHAEAMRRHDEAMQAGDRRHAEAMAALADQRREAAEAAEAARREAAGQRRALEALIAGMESMIERTAPKPRPGAPAE